MTVRKEDVRVEYTKGKGPGGQRKNKVMTAVRLTHVATGVTVFIDGRNRGVNERKAWDELYRKIAQREAAEKAKKKKAARDAAIKDTKVVRTYNFARGTVKDHRSGKTASLKEVMDKGRIDLLREDKE